jgi:hypothetical protein
MPADTPPFKVGPILENSDCQELSTFEISPPSRSEPDSQNDNKSVAVKDSTSYQSDDPIDRQIRDAIKRIDEAFALQDAMSDEFIDKTISLDVMKNDPVGHRILSAIKEIDNAFTLQDAMSDEFINRCRAY